MLKKEEQYSSYFHCITADFSIKKKQNKKNQQNNSQDHLIKCLKTFQKER